MQKPSGKMMMKMHAHTYVKETQVSAQQSTIFTVCDLKMHMM